MRASSLSTVVVRGVLWHSFAKASGRCRKMASSTCRFASVMSRNMSSKLIVPAAPLPQSAVDASLFISLEFRARFEKHASRNGEDLRIYHHSLLSKILTQALTLANFLWGSTDCSRMSRRDSYSITFLHLEQTQTDLHVQ